MVINGHYNNIVTLSDVVCVISMAIPLPGRNDNALDWRGRRREGKGREGKGGEGKGREEKGGKGREGEGRGGEGEGREGKGRRGRGREVMETAGKINIIQMRRWKL